MIRTDLRYQWASGYSLYALACCALASAAFAVGAYGTARGALTSLHEEWAFLHEEGGYAFTQAIGLDDPTDAPLQDTWHQAGTAMANLHIVQSTVSLLQVLCFVIAPVMFFTYGAVAATRDTYFKTLKFRAVRAGHQTLFVSQIATLVTMVAALTVAAMTLAVLISTGLSWATSGRLDDPLVSVPSDLPVTDLIAPMLALLSTGVFFALLGMGAGLALRRPLYVIPLFSALFFVLPVAGRFDPRNLLMTLAYPHMAFTGGFTPTIPTPVPQVPAALALMTEVLALLAIAYISTTRRSRYT
ncbi:hypothetical protein [Streptomyces showdoensis]|uniref:Uncharacterized protein n=1 Tax=Streptomyces showdoensis TaxID=68268 RepID=A0A2P2GM49_STREW|nr:hypothetical protein [Streptomyces showdoensis]KKZ72576.1 hypothetical protein VO63_17740 [Streptomyces showdoensis]